jgi:diacylglycerol kinase family enzyme
MSSHAEVQTTRAVLVMNPGSGGGKVARFGLVEVAEQMGVRVLLTGPGQDAAVLAHRALADGAEVLGVAGGDGTVSAVAAVAAQADRPLVVVPAGTRNHFARDLGLDIHDPAAGMAALRSGDPCRVDLGLVAGRTFVNNVSFGMYAEALLVPGYREAKGLTMASVAGPYLEGRRWVDASVDAPGGTIDHPQVVLISNNPYHVATPRYLGRRFALDRGVLGVLVLKRAEGAAPDLLPDILRGISRPATHPAGESVVRWSAPRVSLHGAAATIVTGVDGEAVTLPLPLGCEIRPQALRVILPKDRPGIPSEPHPPRPARRRSRPPQVR